MASIINMTLSEIKKLLSNFVASNSITKFSKLLDECEKEIEHFRKDIRRKQQRQSKEDCKLKYSQSHAATDSPHGRSAATRSYIKDSQDKAVLTLRSHLTSKDTSGAVSDQDVSYSSSAGSQKPESTTVVPVSALTSQAQATPPLVESEQDTVSALTSQPQATPPFVESEQDIGAKLEHQIQACKDSFHDQTLIIPTDGHTETVHPDEVCDFFSQFQEGRWLSNFNLMPLIFSFPWPSTTLLLNSSYMPKRNQNQSPPVHKKRWPLNSSHDRIILPCCSGEHWTLFDVNLKDRSLRRYDSLGGDISGSAQLASMVEERLRDAMSLQSDISLTRENGASQQQSNYADCGVFMLHNAECLAIDRNTLQEKVTGVQLRYRFLERLLQLERIGKSERQIMDTVLGSGKKIRVKRRRIPEDLSCTEASEDQEPKKPRMTSWTPPSDLGPKIAWLEERDSLIGVVRQSEKSELECRQRAEELLSMIEVIGCREIRAAWEESVIQRRSQVKPQSQALGSAADAINRLTERTEVRTLTDKVMVRIGKWMFAIKILQEVEKFRRQGPPSKQRAETALGGNAVTRAMTLFMEEVNQNVSDPDRPNGREQEYQKYKKWWNEGQIWIALCNAMGAGILLLIPGDPCASRGRRISNKHFVKMRSGERKPFIKSLQRLRPELTKLDFGSQLEVLDDEVGFLLGRFRIQKSPGVEAID